jgi:hypothetical protein
MRTKYAAVYIELEWTRIFLVNVILHDLHSLYASEFLVAGHACTLVSIVLDWKFYHVRVQIFTSALNIPSGMMTMSLISLRLKRLTRARIAQKECNYCVLRAPFSPRAAHAASVLSPKVNKLLFVAIWSGSCGNFNYKLHAWDFFPKKEYKMCHICLYLRAA